MKRYLLLTLLVSVLLAPSLAAQEDDVAPGRVGLTFPGLGAIWHLSGTLALVPSVSISHSWENVGSISSPRSDNTSLSIGAAARFYAYQWKGVRFYLTPKYALGRSTNSSTYVSSGQDVKTNATSNVHTVTGAWGIQYAVNDRISLYGDIGAFYGRSIYHTTSLAAVERESRSNNVGTVGSWGLIFYLK